MRLHGVQCEGKFPTMISFPTLGEWVEASPDHAGWPRKALSERLPPRMPDGSPWPTVSIITPSLNQARFIADAIASVANQGYPAFEHLVVDGGSADGTLEILRAQGAAVSWIAEPDTGQADAVNKGFARATGEILGWLNADDYYEAGAVRAVAEFTARHPDVDVVYGDCLYLYQDVTPAELRLVRSRAFDLAYLLNVGCFIHQPATFFRRSALVAGPLNTRLRYAMDYELWLRMARAGKRFAYLPVTLATFRITEASKSGASLTQFWPEVRATSRRYGGRFFSPMLLRHLKDRLSGRWPGPYGSAKRAYTWLFGRSAPGAG
jgi:glycosyltransferase involved in cell wall biosynthesis